ncbi:MAG: hypothetical protein NC251_01030 [Lachnoclostridium sp.]|nr:hypothetical protein [Lachnoclostridium sp.]
MPQITVYIVVGYIFIKTYRFVALKKDSDNIEHILTSSLVVGFIYYEIARMIPFTISREVDNLLIGLSALFLGYLLALLSRQKKIVYWILDKLSIHDTNNAYIWDDLMDVKNAMKVRVVYDEEIYEGMLHNYESYSNAPRIVLAAYTVKSLPDQKVCDYSQDNTRIVILNTDAARSVEIIYYSESDECKDLKNLCDAGKRFKR